MNFCSPRDMKELKNAAMTFGCGGGGGAMVGCLWDGWVGVGGWVGGRRKGRAHGIVRGVHARQGFLEVPRRRSTAPAQGHNRGL